MILELKEKKDLFILLRQEQHILANGLEDLEMAMVFKYGQMEQDMKVINPCFLLIIFILG